MSFNKINGAYLENPLFTITNSKVIFHFKTEELQLDLNLISNVRIKKSRVLYINIFITVIAIKCYLYISDFLGLLLPSFYFPIVLAAILYFSFLYKHFSHKLLINNKNLHFNELKITKKNIVYAQYFLSLYENNEIK